MELSRNQDNTRTRLREFRKVLGSGEILESFDRVVFESVVEKIVIGGYNNEGVEEPLKITFEYKTGIHSNFNGKDFKPKRKNAAAVHNDAELCSYTSDEAEKLCLHSSSDTCGSCNVADEGRYLEILDFTLFFDHFVFTPNAENALEKELKKEIPVSVGIELVVVDMSENVDFKG